MQVTKNAGMNVILVRARVGFVWLTDMSAASQTAYTPSMNKQPDTTRNTPL